MTKPSVSQINPMIVEGSLSDTCYQVSNVLAFMANVMSLADDDTEGLDFVGAAQGASLVLQTCRRALAYHLQKDEAEAESGGDHDE